ncbi:MAG: potassium channel family protein [Actinomycetota bacterium]|nr:two pore domain potassium channel family protein [Rubrobacter sp.]MDQ3506911.1 potassium channel family protein [Actinomycetota bacterium]
MISFLVTLARFFNTIRASLKEPEFQALSFLVAVTLLSGTLFYRSVEGWGILDSLYFSVITLTTIGYGDLAPATNVGKIFTIVYVFVGVGLIAAFIGKIASRSIEARASRTNHRPASPRGELPASPAKDPDREGEETMREDDDTEESRADKNSL